MRTRTIVTVTLPQALALLSTLVALVKQLPPLPHIDAQILPEDPIQKRTLNIIEQRGSRLLILNGTVRHIRD